MGGNSNTIAYVQVKTDEGKIVFSTGETIKLNAKESEAFAKFLRTKFIQDIGMPGTFKTNIYLNDIDAIEAAYVASRRCESA